MISFDIGLFNILGITSIYIFNELIFYAITFRDKEKITNIKV